MKFRKIGIYNLAIMALLFSFTVKADDMNDVLSLLDSYIETESDLMAQNALMSEDRIFIIGAPAVRMTDNKTNMMRQMHVNNRSEEMDPNSIYMQVERIRLSESTATLLLRVSEEVLIFCQVQKA